jgi:Zn-finger protein
MSETPALALPEPPSLAAPIVGDEAWRGKEYSFFSHRKCEAFPCHETACPDDFNCLFCYCPLYALGERCGGDFAYTPRGAKDCGGCAFPHARGNYGRVIEMLKEIK